MEFDLLHIQRDDVQLSHSASLLHGRVTATTVIIFVASDQEGELLGFSRCVGRDDGMIPCALESQNLRLLVSDLHCHMLLFRELPVKVHVRCHACGHLVHLLQRKSGTMTSRNNSNLIAPAVWHVTRPRPCAKPVIACHRFI